VDEKSVTDELVYIQFFCDCQTCATRFACVTFWMQPIFQLFAEVTVITKLELLNCAVQMWIFSLINVEPDESSIDEKKDFCSLLYRSMFLVFFQAKSELNDEITRLKMDFDSASAIQSLLQEDKVAYIMQLYLSIKSCNSC
jgi:hypothetical protein